MLRDEQADKSRQYDKGDGDSIAETAPKRKYLRDKHLPKGWKFMDTAKNGAFFKTGLGKVLTSRKKALVYMYEQGGFSKDEIYYIRDGLLYEDWSYHRDLPPGWMYKKYTHKIEGVDTQIIHLMSPAGIVFKSRVKIKKSAAELKLSDEDLKLLLDFKIDDVDEPKKLENPGDEWYFDEACIPEGWKMKLYSYNSRVSNKVEEVFHYLAPDFTILRGRKQVYDYMVKNDLYNLTDFQKFHFSKKEPKCRDVTRGSWSDWKVADELPEGWKYKQCEQEGQSQYRYQSPCGKKFQSKSAASKFLLLKQCPPKEGSSEDSMFSISKKKSHAGKKKRKRDGGSTIVKNKLNGNGKSIIHTTWDEWRPDEIPCLLGWQFSIGRKGVRRRIRYKSPTGEVFKSRGPLLRYLQDNNLKTRRQLAALKRLLKTNQGLPFGELRKNDKFIKKFDVDCNYLEFIKIRYENESHDHIPEVTDPKLPFGWKKKNINGVDYFKDPTGSFVFNSRKLVVEHLKKNCYDLSDDQLLSILEDSESESDLSEDEDVVDSDKDENEIVAVVVDVENNNVYEDDDYLITF